MRFVLGFTARSGFVFGNSPFFDQLFAMGGTQYGIPLRGYDEFSVTPNGYDPSASSTAASASAFGRSFYKMTGEVGLRLSQMFYLSTFYDARSEEHTSELQSLAYLVCRLLLEKKKKTKT